MIERHKKINTSISETRNSTRDALVYVREVKNVSVLLVVFSKRTPYREEKRSDLADESQFK